ncbi:MAG: beta-galactosidase [bacterium]
MTKRRQKSRIAIICCAALGALFLLFGQFWLMSALSWTHREPPAKSVIGFNFSCDQAEYVLLEKPGDPSSYVDDNRPGRAEWCASILDRLFVETGAKAVRLSIQWDEVEPREGEFDFTLPDALIATAASNHATVMLSVGMKAQRHPEYYIPDWAMDGLDLPNGTVVSDVPSLRDEAFALIERTVQRYATSTTVDSWGAENEAYIASHRSDRWSLSPEYVAQVVKIIHGNDPLRRPVSINHAQHFVMDQHWQTALADSDVLGQSLYPARNGNLFGVKVVANIMEIGPLMPNYAYQARTAVAAGKQFWVTELQGEPWTENDSRLITPSNPSDNLTAAGLRENIAYARKTGAARIYLWGSEWWLYQEGLGDRSWLSVVQEAVRSSR